MNFTIKKNPSVTNCVSKLELGQSVLKKTKIIYDYDDILKNITVSRNLIAHRPKITVNSYVAAFDFDWTLAYHTKKLYHPLGDDTYVLPCRRKILEEFIKNGYTIVIFSNQLVNGKNMVDRIVKFLTDLNLPVFFYCSLMRDDYRKPEIGMWNQFLMDTKIKVEYAFFCGDASGDDDEKFASDRKFAENVGIKYYLPNEIFPSNENQIATTIRDNKNQKKCVIFVGMPGAGKSTFYHKYFKDYVHVNQDILKTKEKVIQTISYCLSHGYNFVLDGQNYAQETIPSEARGRMDTIIPSLKAGYKIFIVFFARDGRSQDIKREKETGIKRKSIMVYNLYFSRFISPTNKNSFGEVFVLN